MGEQVRENIKKEAKRIEEDSLHSSKGHFYAAQFWSNFHLLIGIPTSVFAAIAGISALSQFDKHSVVAGALAIIVAALSAISTFLNPNEKTTRHHTAGNLYNSLRNSARIFHEIVLATNDETVLQELKKMNRQRDELNQKSPQIPKWAFRKARRGIEEGEAEYKN